MGRFGGEARTDDQGRPGRIFIEKRAEGFEEKGEVLLIGFPAADGNDLVLFGDSGVEFKDIGLNGVRNAVDFGRVDPEAGSEGIPKSGRVRGFDKNGGQEFQSFL